MFTRWAQRRNPNISVWTTAACSECKLFKWEGTRAASECNRPTFLCPKPSCIRMVAEKLDIKSKGLIGKFPSVTAVYMVGPSTWVYPTTCLQVHPSLHFISVFVLPWNGACTYRISSWFVVHCCSSVSRQTTKRWQQWQKTVHDTNVRRYHVHRIKKIIHVCLYLHCSWRNAACFGSWEEVEHAKVCSLVRLGCLWAWKGAHTLLGWWPLFCMQGCVTQACLKIACCVEDFNYLALWIIARNVPLGIFALHWTTGEWCWQG